MDSIQTLLSNWLASAPEHANVGDLPRCAAARRAESCVPCPFGWDRSPPATALEAAGFHRTGIFEHSEYWLSADGTPVQITDDPVLSACIACGGVVEIDGLPLPILAPLDLLRDQLRAAKDPARRRSKRLQDLADAQGLVEDQPEPGAALEPAERVVLDQLRP